jgi:hypothetical protein
MRKRFRLAGFFEWIAQFMPVVTYGGELICLFLFIDGLDQRGLQVHDPGR